MSAIFTETRAILKEMQHIFDQNTDQDGLVDIHWRLEEATTEYKKKIRTAADTIRELTERAKDTDAQIVEPESEEQFEAKKEAMENEQLTLAKLANVLEDECRGLQNNKRHAESTFTKVSSEERKVEHISRSNQDALAIRDLYNFIAPLQWTNTSSSTSWEANICVKDSVKKTKDIKKMTFDVEQMTRFQAVNAFWDQTERILSE
eukprot:Clim_evm48s207 gene=Clim_evmTU48s207